MKTADLDGFTSHFILRLRFSVYITVLYLYLECVGLGDGRSKFREFFFSLQWLVFFASRAKVLTSAWMWSTVMHERKPPLGSRINWISVREFWLHCLHIILKWFSICAQNITIKYYFTLFHQKLNCGSADPSIRYTSEVGLRNVQHFISCQPLKCNSITKPWNSTQVSQSQVELQGTCQSSDSSFTYICVLNQNQGQKGLGLVKHSCGSLPESLFISLPL